MMVNIVRACLFFFSSSSSSSSSLRFRKTFTLCRQRGKVDREKKNSRENTRDCCCCAQIFCDYYYRSRRENTGRSALVSCAFILKIVATETGVEFYDESPSFFLRCFDETLRASKQRERKK